MLNRLRTLASPDWFAGLARELARAAADPDISAVSREAVQEQLQRIRTWFPDLAAEAAAEESSGFPEPQTPAADE